MYASIRKVGYSSDVVTTDLGFTDYVPNNPSGYQSGVITINLGYIDYIIDRFSYSYANISTTSNVWEGIATNWEVINTNWENL